MTRILDVLEKLAKAKKEGGICGADVHAEKLREKIAYIRSKSPYKDDILFLNKKEEELLGISLSASKIDRYNTSEVTHTCRQFVTSIGQNSRDIWAFGVDVIDVKEYTTRSGEHEGQRRADLVVADRTGKMKVKVWSDIYEPNIHLFIKRNSLILKGKKGWGKYEEFLIVTEAKQAV